MYQFSYNIWITQVVINNFINYSHQSSTLKSAQARLREIENYCENQSSCLLV